MSNVETSVEAHQEVSIPARKLGDTWDGWAGEVEENNGDLETSPWYFLSFATAVLLTLTAIIWTALFLIEPRLAELPVWLSRTITMSVWGVLAAVNFMFALIVATVATGVNFVPFMKGRHIALSTIIPYSVKFGKLFGLSKDRISNSILQVGNRLTVANQGSIERDELLILLPRCLDKQTRDDIKLMTSKYDVDFHICAGGQMARQLLTEKKPKGVIAVACERDLMAGVQDVKAAVPVIAIANKRPEGPCRNTNINMTEMENAIRMYLGKELLPVDRELVEQN
ncbi:DUF116 domain-containing protein [Tumebacillus flagellatus]|uniref:DUF116 domain-containing protein n=1 Tax=Tumebacillus flagellatus TaxID=1157490 RepID=A0A074LWF9_9BACL|nr:DUF116 domain-containing protein [Tumebacillus flagellatus]KEO85204.1 hypothetical protein EL26_01200 [Tumebacillus flagellatus]